MLSSEAGDVSSSSYDNRGFVEKRETKEKTAAADVPDQDDSSGASIAARFDKHFDSIDFISTDGAANGGIGTISSSLNGFVALDASHSHGKAEPTLVLFCEVLIPFLIAGIGMVLAGLVFDRVQHWQFFQEIPQALILVPALLGLKGNLEMTLASRLSTQANTGNMEGTEQICNTILTSVTLIETQALVVTFLATGASLILAWIPRGELNWFHAVILFSTAASTATVASLFLSLLMIGIVIISRWCSVNPDNVATPIAAALGDLTTLSILAVTGRIFMTAVNSPLFIGLASISFLFMVPIFGLIAWRDKKSREVLTAGWTPIISSMLISSSGGFVLERSLQAFKQIAVYQPVMNGVGGNLAAVAASKLSTYYHKNAEPGILPSNWSMSRFLSFRRAFFSADFDSRAARVFLFLVVPGHIVFNWIISILHSRSVVNIYDNQEQEFYVSGPVFTALYMIAALTQVATLLYFCQLLVAWMWKRGHNPDNSAIPYLTALGDLIGTFLLYIAFLILSVLSPDELHGGSVSIITSSTSTPISENASVVLPSAVNSP